MLQPAAAALAGEAGRLCENLFRHSGFDALLLSHPICILHKIKCCCRRFRSPPGLQRTCSSDRVVLHLGMLSGQRFYVNANNMMSSMLHRLISSGADTRSFINYHSMHFRIWIYRTIQQEQQGQHFCPIKNTHCHLSWLWE